MIRNKRLVAVAVACSAALVLGACSGVSGETPGGPGDSPVPGGTGRVLQISEPRSLDPAAMANAYAVSGFLGNALYGTLMINDAKTGEVTFTMAEDFSTGDGGATFTLKLRPGLQFTDGSPLDAAAVKFNWDRIKDPKTGSINLPEAAMIASSKVVDASTLEVQLVDPIPGYAQAVLASSMNWIASPKALKAGEQAFDANPVGAGPYTLKKWTRQDTIELVKNPGYWNAPKPYLDGITLRTTTDANQRINTLTSGGADVTIDSNWANVAKAETAGLPTDVMPLNGGLFLVLNTRRAPFDDVRARKAVAAALDLDGVNATVYNGKGKPVRTLFTESSPFYSDIELGKRDKAAAQQLFDELAAEGKPVSFTFKTLPSSEHTATAESVQAQLSAFNNVDVKVEKVDFSQLPALHSQHDFDVFISSAFFTDPEPRLWSVFHGDSRLNMSGIDDEALSAALQTGRNATSTKERKAAYDTAQQRLIDLVPVVFYTRAAPSALTGKNVGGVVQYGNGSLLPEELWIQK